MKHLTVLKHSSDTTNSLFRLTQCFMVMRGWGHVHLAPVSPHVVLNVVYGTSVTGDHTDREVSSHQTTASSNR